MKKASDILLLIAGIVSIMAAIFYLVLMIVFFVLGSVDTSTIAQYIREGKINSSINGTAEEQAEVIKVLFVVLAIVFLILTVFTVVNAVISFVGKARGTKGLYIANIVFGILSSVVLNLVGGILGVVAVSQDNGPTQVTQA